MRRRITVGTRGSALAQWQARYVVERLKEMSPDVAVEITIIKTEGDRDQQRSLADLGGLGLFTKAIEDALLSRQVDIAVHSLKDLPTEPAPGLAIAAYPAREDARDCLVSRHHHGVRQLPPGARVGTSSARRAAQIRALRPDVEIVPLRGNVDTRLAKAHADDYDAIVLAAAGINRLGKSDQITEYLSLDDVLPDPGQGSLAVQVRTSDSELFDLVHRIDDSATRLAVSAERSFLAALGGGCRLPIAAYAEIREARLEISGMVASSDGSWIVRDKLAGDAKLAEHLGSALAVDLLGRGAGQILGLAPLAGKRILVTRAKDQAKELSGKIQSLGGDPVEFPVIAFAPIENTQELNHALEGHYDWIVFTSANGVDAVASRLKDLGLGKGTLATSKMAAIGPATARSLARLGLPVDFVPSRFLGKQIAFELPVRSGDSALLLRADLASNALADGLRARGVLVKDVDAYRTVQPPLPDFDLSDIDAITFTSSSTVRNFMNRVDGQLSQLAKAALVCIGPVTAETAHELGLRPDAVASVHTIDGMLAAMLDYFGHR